MACLISTITTWTAPVYYGLYGLASEFIFPFYIKANPSTIKTEETALKAKNLKLIVDVARRVGGLRKDIQVYCSPLARSVDIQGTNFRVSSVLGTEFKPEAILVYNPEMESIDQDSFKFMLMCALFHIKFSDSIRACSVAVISSTVTAYATSHIQSHTSCWVGIFLSVLPHVCGRIAYQLTENHGQTRAHNFALVISTEDELRSIEKCYRKMIEDKIAINRPSIEYTSWYHLDKDSIFQKHIAVKREIRKRK